MVNDEERFESHEQIQRVSVLDEIWVLHPGAKPDIYLTLLHKVSKNWWENPGGQIDGQVNAESILEASFRERDEESRIDAPLLGEQLIRIETDPHEAVRLFGQFERSIPPKTLNRLIPPLQSHLVVSRRIYSAIPVVLIGADQDPAHLREHDDYRLLDVHGLYYLFGRFGTGSLVTSTAYIKKTMADLVFKNMPVELLTEEDLPHVVSFFERNENRMHGREMLIFSQETAISLWRYAMCSYQLEKLLPVTASGVLRSDMPAEAVIRPFT